jgi:hypothetical protein
VNAYLRKTPLKTSLKRVKSGSFLAKTSKHDVFAGVY